MAAEQETQRLAAEAAAPKKRRTRHDKGKKRGPRKTTAERTSRMGPVALIRATKGYGRVIPPGHAAMLAGGEPLPDWARAYGSGNSGEEGDEAEDQSWPARLERAARKRTAAETADKEAASAAEALDGQHAQELADAEERAGDGTMTVSPVDENDEVATATFEEATPGLVVMADEEARGDEARPQPWRARRKTGRRNRRVRWAKEAMARTAEAAREADEGSTSAGGNGEGEAEPWLVRRQRGDMRTDAGQQRQNQRSQRQRERKRRLAAFHEGGDDAQG